MKLSSFILLSVFHFSTAATVSRSFTQSEHKYSDFTSVLKRQTASGHQLPRRGALKDDQRTKYLIPVTISNQTVHLEIDTGSSDTWILQSNYQCYQTFDNSTKTFKKPESSSVCNYGKTLDLSSDSDFKPIPDLHQLTCYGATTAAALRCTYGPFGHIDVTINGLTVPHQIISAANETSNPNPTLPEYSGLLGLAFPAATFAYNSSDKNASVHYPSIMKTLFGTPLFKDPKSQQFSIALSRDASSTGKGGFLTIGGIPDLSDPSINATSKSTSAPLQYFYNSSKTEYTFYSITVDSFRVGDKTMAPDTPVIIDSGYNGLEIPEALVNQLNKKWVPAGNVSGTTVFLDCDAKLSEQFGITIGGGTYYIDSTDLVGRMENGSCYSLFYPGFPPNGYSLGDPLLRNTLAVFDWGQKAMSFYPRMYYKS